MPVRAAFFLGVILTAAIAITIVRCRQFPSFREWWDAEGAPIWIVTIGLAGSLYTVL